MQKKTIKLVLTLFIAALMMSCATSRVMKTAHETYPVTDPVNIELFLTKQPIKPYKEIGRVSADKFNALGMSRSGDEIHRLLKEKAASIGGNAIINITEDLGNVTGVVIVFTAIPKGEKAKEIEAMPLPVKNETKATEPSNEKKPPKLFLKVMKSGNIRSTPSTSSKIIAKVKKGEMLQGQGKSGDWYIITLPSGEGGWVFKGLVKVVD